MSEPTLEMRIQALEDREKIKEHKQKMAIAADPNMDIDMFVNLYCEDGAMEIVNWGIFEGRDGIRAFLEINPFKWMFHCLVPLYINVAPDCKTATGRFYLFEAAEVYNIKSGKHDPVWVMGAYDDKLKKVDGEWQFELTSLTQQIVTPYEDGWRESRLNLSPDWKKPVDEFLAKL